jgi:hypothetical protein
MTSIATPPKLQFFDANGNPLAGGKLYTYAAGTTTPLATYTDYGGGTANSNPVVLNARGEASVWFGTSQYKLKLTDADDVEVYTVDNLNGPDVATLALLAASSGSSLIGYINSGTGAVARTVQDRLRDYISVKDFGAVGNGSTNDVTAIQAAINAAAARPPSGGSSGLGGISGATVYFPSGVYRINSGITIPDGVKLVGSGERATVIKYYGSGAAVSNPTPGTRIGKIGIMEMTIKDEGTGTIGLDLNSVSYSEFTSLWIDGFDTAVKMTSPTNGWSVYNRFYNVTANYCTTGFWIAATSTNAHTFYACRYNTDTVNSGGIGWKIENSNGNQIIACHGDMVSNTTYFAKLTASSANLTDGNVFWGNRIEGDPSYTVYGFDVGTNVGYTVIGGNYYTAITQTRNLTDNGTGTNMADPSWATPGISGYFPWDGVVNGQIVYKRDGSGGTYNPFMVLNDNNSSSGTPVTLQVVTQRQTGQSIQVLRQTTAANISGITQANPCVVTTSAAHGITVGSKVAFASIGGMTQLNGVTTYVTATTSTTITLGGINSTSYTAYTSGGTVTPQTTQFAVGGDGMVVQQTIASAASSPFENAKYIGQLFVDTNGNQAYISYRTGFGSGDWKIIT